MRILISMLAVTVVAAQRTSVGEKLVKEGDCFSCHAQNGQSVGPSFAAIARKLPPARFLVCRDCPALRRTGEFHKPALGTNSEGRFRRLG